MPSDARTRKYIEKNLKAILLDWSIPIQWGSEETNFVPPYANVRIEASQYDVETDSTEVDIEFRVRTLGNSEGYELGNQKLEELANILTAHPDLNGAVSSVRFDSSSLEETVEPQETSHYLRQEIWVAQVY